MQEKPLNEGNMRGSIKQETDIDRRPTSPPPSPVHNPASQPLNQQQQMDQIAMQRMLRNANHVICECGCKVFKPGISFLKVSAMDPNNPNGQPQVAQAQVYYCVKCSQPIDNQKL